MPSVAVQIPGRSIVDLSTATCHNLGPMYYTVTPLIMVSHSAKGLASAGEYQVESGASFLQATTVQRGDIDSEYQILIPSDWCFGPIAHGGYLSGLLTRTVEQHISHVSGADYRQLPNILDSCNTTYLAPVLPGPASIRIENRFVGGSTASYIASLYQGAGREKDTTISARNLRVEATVSTTSMSSSKKTTLSRPMNPRQRISTADLYSRKPGGFHDPHKDSGMSFYKHKPGWECYFNAESADRMKMLNKHAQHGPAVFDVWWKFDHAITIHELGFLADLIGPVLFNYEDVRKTHWLSTRQMGVDVVRLPEEGQSGWNWLFCRMELIENAGDRFYCDVTMTDEAGNVVGLARQSCIVRPFELVGKSKGKKNNVKDAKAKI